MVGQSPRERMLRSALIVGLAEAFAGVALMVMPYLITLPDSARIVFLAVGVFQFISGSAIVAFREKLVTFLIERRRS